MLRRRGALALLLLISVLAPAGAAAAPEARRLTVTPSTDLVHGQTIVVRGTGFAPNQLVGVLQCRPGSVDPTRDCNFDLSFAQTGANGRFRTTLRADTILDGDDPVDCRLVTCRIVAFQRQSPASAPIHFDPDGPDPPRPTVAITPDADLVHGQEVTVDISDIPTDSRGNPIDYLEVSHCTLPLDASTDCTLGDLVFLDGDGTTATTTIAVEGRLLLPRRYADCRTQACGLVVGTDSLPRSQVGVVPLDLDPESPVPAPPAATVEPDTGLVDGQELTVHGTGWPTSYGRARVYQCPADWERPRRDCAEPSRWTDPRASADGELTGTLLVRTVVRPTDQPPTDCRVEDCVLFVDPYVGVPAPLELPLTFDPEAEPLRPRLEVTPRTDLDRVQGVRVDGQGFVPAEARLRLYQCVGRPSRPADNRHCDLQRNARFEPTGTSFTRRLGVHRVIQTRADGTVDCRVRTCRVWAFERWDRAIPSERLVFARP